MSRRRAVVLGCLCAVAVQLALAGQARAEIKIKFSGLVSADFRYRFNGYAFDPIYPSQYQLLKNGFSRNENRIRAKIEIAVGTKVKGVADVELVYWGYSDVLNIDSATLREKVDPYFIEAHAAYIDIYKLLPGLDLRIGRQIVQWGASDQFNPTSNVNTLDFSDALTFGRALANNMVRADWNPKGDFTITGVWIPIFRPAQLPRTAPLALKPLTAPEDPSGRTRIFHPADVQDPLVLSRLELLSTLMPPKYIAVTTLQPPVSEKNFAYALRMSGRVLDQDVSLSYYRGRFGIPVPAWTINKPDGSAEVGVVWPRFDQLGADVAGSINKLGGLGYWVEMALVFPEEVTYGIYNDSNGGHVPITFSPTGVILFREGPRPVVIRNTPFVKMTYGHDFSIGDHLYFNLQYLHGFIDEFGAGTIARLPGAMDVGPRIEQRLGDYIVAGADLKVLGGNLLFRLFGVLKLPSYSFETGKWDPYRGTGVLFPQIIWQVWDSTQLMCGAFLFLGDRSTKFGDPAAGASEVFVKAKLTF